MIVVAVQAKKLDVKVGDVVEIDERTYEVVPDEHGGVALEPAITKVVAELREQRAGHGVSPREFVELFGDLPRDGEG